MRWLFKLLLLQNLGWFLCFHTKNRLCWSSVFPAILTPAMRLDLRSPGEKRTVNNPEPGEGPTWLLSCSFSTYLQCRSHLIEGAMTFNTSEPNPSGFSCPLSWSIIIYHHPQKVMIYNDRPSYFI